MKKTPEELVIVIQDACEQLGWHIGMDASQEMLPGIVIGKHEYVLEVVEQLENGDYYEVYSSGKNEDVGLH